MNDKATLTRRQLIGSGLVLGSSAVGTSALGIAQPCHARESNRSAQPLAQDYSVAAKIPTPDHYMHDPGMARLPNGRVFVAAPCYEFRDKGKSRKTRKWRAIKSHRLLLSKSDDGGQSWRSLGTMPCSDATPFVHDGKLHMFVPRGPGGALLLFRSDDEGETWTKPSRILKGGYWNCSTGMAVANGQLYWGLTKGACVVIAGDLSKDLMDPGAWRMSSTAGFPGVPGSLTRKLYPPGAGTWPVQWGSDTWLEPNVVCVNGHLRALLRVIIDEYATAGICGVCDLEDDGDKMELKFTQFYSLPGAQNKFYILYDDVSRLFWMASNAPTDSQDFQGNKEKLLEIGYHGGPGNERRLLMLYYSLDSLNWFPAGCIAMWPSPLQAFMYPCMALDGDDIVLISRTSKDGSDQHDADLVTFHRVRDFRSLALDLYPKFPGT